MTWGVKVTGRLAPTTGLEAIKLVLEVTTKQGLIIFNTAADVTIGICEKPSLYFLSEGDPKANGNHQHKHILYCSLAAAISN